nr:pentatricopeptide repeat-containing protein At2g22410, mitochondrial [Ipomoea trifida]
MVPLFIIKNLKSPRQFYTLEPHLLGTSFRTSSSFISGYCLLTHHKAKYNWNTTHSFVLSNPLLSLLENQCKCMAHLKQIQAQMVTTGLFSDGFASSRLIAFCAISEMGSLDYCKVLLYHMQNSNSFSWNVAIRGYTESQHPIEALFLYKELLVYIDKHNDDDTLRPDNYTFPLLFKVCSRLSLFYMGFEILVHVMKMGHYQDRFVHNALVHFLVCSGELEVAKKVLGENCARDVVSWNSLINGYVKSGRPCEALRAFREMRIEGVEPDEITMIGMALTCSQLGNLELGMEFHRYVVEKEMNMSLPLCNSLMDMYVKCGDLEKAKTLFNRMEERTAVTWTTMIVGYARFGFLDDARKLFDEFQLKSNVVTWNAMIGAYVQAQCGKEALELFQQMQAMNVRPDEVTMVSCLSACSQLGALDVGCWIHHYVEIHNLSLTVSLGTALVDMYAKCGNVEKALKVFHEMPVRNSLTWTAVIGALALHGDARNALSHFAMMVDAGVAPDDVTFLEVLLACCHGGLVEEGHKIFTEMSSRFNVPPKPKHYACMVDLLGRAGLLKEAEALIVSMPTNADAAVWGALFFACRVHRNVELGEKAALKLLKMDPDDSGTYVLLANMYVGANMLHKAREVRKMMSKRGLEKTPGCSSIEVNGNVFEFTVRDRLHAQSDKIYECVIQLTRQMGQDEYVPNTPLYSFEIGC